MSNLSFDEILDTESISRVLFKKLPETRIIPKGYRILSKTNLKEHHISSLISKFNNLEEIFNSDEESLREIFNEDFGDFKKEINNLREQIMVGKKI